MPHNKKQKKKLNNIIVHIGLLSFVMNSLVRKEWKQHLLKNFCFCFSVFLIDHAWTYQLEFARKQLERIPGLRDRMASLMGIQGLSAF